MKSTRDCRSDLSIVRRGNIDNRIRGLANVRVFETYIYCTLYFIYSVLFAGEGGMQVGPIHVFEHKGGGRGPNWYMINYKIFLSECYQTRVNFYRSRSGWAVTIFPNTVMHS